MMSVIAPDRGGEGVTTVTVLGLGDGSTRGPPGTPPQPDASSTAGQASETGRILGDVRDRPFASGRRARPVRLAVAMVVAVHHA
ncbi:hypothetical protein [Streptosporangium sp. NPDC000396]|uniref:hypothetical protein n=1 Tax=Streptosporangium sp. NPDC000396 TaxID=3366185 RepID=UPI0036ABE3CF